MKIDLFLETEKKYGLLNDTVEGMYYWNLCRYDIFQYRFVEKKLGLAQAHSGKKKTFMDRVKHKMALVYYSTFFSRIPEKNVDICFVNHPRRVKRADVYECIYTERLTKDFESSVVLEKPYLDGHLRPVKTKNLVYTDKVSVQAMKELKKVKTTQYYQSVRNQIAEKLNEPLKELAEGYEVEIDINKIVNFCTEKTILCSLKKPYFEKYLQKINPKVIVEVVHYNRDCMTVTEIAKQMNIPVVELQHGTMGGLQSAYQFAEGTEFYHLPDKILTFSEFWNNAISLPNKEQVVTAVGYPYFEEQVMYYKKQIAHDKEKKTVVFVSQGTVSEKLSKLAVGLANLSNGSVRIIYKLHPSEYERWRGECPWLVHSNIEVVDNNLKNIYAYFAESDMQVGVYSTAIYEGLAFGIKTCIYDMAMADTMKALCDGGYARLVKNEADILEYLEEEHAVQDEETTFWKSDAYENIRKILEEIVNR